MKTTTLFPWPGGKTRLLPHLLPLVAQASHRTYVEAFAGGAALLFAREPARAEVLNDCHGGWCASTGWWPTTLRSSSASSNGR